MRNSFLIAVVVLTAALVTMGGCKDLLTKHNIVLGEVEHGEKLHKKGPKSCTSCHGVHLNGNGFIPGCTNCHPKFWSMEDHNMNWGGVPHKYGFPVESECNDCHGTYLMGGKRNNGEIERSSCYDSACHDDVWTGKYQ